MFSRLMSFRIPFSSIQRVNTLFLVALVCLPLACFGLQEGHVIRAAIDIGSGATKLRVAEVNTQTNKIVKVLDTVNFAVGYQDAISLSPDQVFDEAIMLEGLDALKQSKEIAAKYGAEKVVAVATASFRKAGNAQEFIDRIYNETGIKVYIIEQQLEGILAFEAATAQVDFDPDDLVVWDIGGGSFQFVMKNDKGEIEVYHGVDASVPFKNHVIKVIKVQDPAKVSTPNPFTFSELRRSESYARRIATKVDRQFKEKFHDPNTIVVGVGNIFAYGIKPLVGNQEHFTRWELYYKLDTLIGKSDEDLGGGPFANVAVTNAALVYGFMQKLGIPSMYIEDINNADGALLYEEFWK